MIDNKVRPLGSIRPYGTMSEYVLLYLEHPGRGGERLATNGDGARGTIRVTSAGKYQNLMYRVCFDYTICSFQHTYVRAIRKYISKYSHVSSDASWLISRAVSQPVLTQRDTCMDTHDMHEHDMY